MSESYYVELAILTLDVDVRRHEHGTVTSVDGYVVEVSAGRKQQPSRMLRQCAIICVYVQPASIEVRAWRSVAATRGKRCCLCRVHDALGKKW